MNFKEKEKFLYLITDTSSLLFFSASGLIVADENQKNINFLITKSKNNNLIAYKKIKTSQINYDTHTNRDEEFPRVLLEIKSDIVDYFESTPIEVQKFKTNDGQIYFEIPFIPIHYLNRIIFDSKKSMEKYQNVDYNNIDKDLIAEMQHDKSFFDYENECEIHENESKNLIPESTINIIDGLLGGIQALIYSASEQHKKQDTTEYVELIENLINKDISELVFKYFGFNIISLSKNGIMDISKNDSTEIKFHKAILIKLLSVSEQSSNISPDLIDEIIDSIPGSILESDEEDLLNGFLDMCENITSGSISLNKNWFIDEDNPKIFVAVIVLLTKIGKNGIDDLLNLYKEEFINNEVFVLTTFLYGCYKQYSSLSKSVKEKSNSKHLSLIIKPLLLTNEKIDRNKVSNPDQTSNWYELSFEKNEIASITIDDPFYISIVAQAREAGFKFVHDGKKNFILKPQKKLEPSLLLKRGIEGHFIIETSPILNAEETKKLTKSNLQDILVLTGTDGFRAGAFIDNDTEELKLKRHQLGTTLDIPEIESMIKDLLINFKKISINLEK